MTPSQAVPSANGGQSSEQLEIGPGQIIGDSLFYPYILGNYWQIFAIIAIICLQKVLLLFAQAIIVPGPGSKR